MEEGKREEGEEKWKLRSKRTEETEVKGNVFSGGGGRGGGRQ